MPDFGVLPPEINSGRMYAGPGSGPMMAAAAAWDALVAQLYSTATGYGSVVAELTDGWRGPASLSMAAAAAPYVAWLHSTAVVAEQTAAAAKEAAAAYELAFAMTVPPPVIAANRSLLLALISTNFFGQNTPAIAATEAHYAEMWIQDATAMYGYAGSSAAAHALTAFTEPRHTTDPTGPAAQSGAVAHALSNAVTASPSASSPTLLDYLEHVPNVTNSSLSSSNAVMSGRGIYITNARLAFQEAQNAEDAGSFGRLVASAPVGIDRASGSAVSAGMGRATLLGALSVPSSWATVAPEIRPVALTLPDPGASPVPAVAADMPPVPGNVFSQSVLGTLSRHGYDEPRPKTKPVLVRSPAAG